MAAVKIAGLTRRGVVVVGGPDAAKFLNDLVTSEIGRIADKGAAYGGLLSPQGKVLFDFIVTAEPETGRFLFDLPRSLVADFVKRLGFYRLRAKVEIADLSAERRVFAIWNGEAPEIAGFADPRAPGLGLRAVTAAAVATNANEAEYDAHRIAQGVPEGGIDFAFGEVFPHDADMEQLQGVDFDKGCYVGQEVVSRMEHRGTARRRFVIVRGEALVAGVEISAGGKPVGTMGSVAGDTGLALVRLDRAREAMNAGVPLVAADRAVTLELPGWARFGWPAAADA